MNKIDDVFETIGQTSPQLCLIHEGNGNPVFPQSGKIFRCNIQVQRRDCACLINGLKKHALLAVSWRRGLAPEIGGIYIYIYWNSYPEIGGGSGVSAAGVRSSDVSAAALTAAALPVCSTVPRISFSPRPEAWRWTRRGSSRTQTDSAHQGFRSFRRNIRVSNHAPQIRSSLLVSPFNVQ